MTAKGTFRHAAIYSSAAILSKAIGFIMLPFYASALGTAGYGAIGMVDAALSLLVSLLAYGFRSTLIRLYHSEEPQHRHAVLSTGICLTAAIVALLVLPCLIAAKPLAHFLFGGPEFTHILLIALAGFFFETVGESAGTLLIIQNRSVLFSVVGLLRLILGLTLNILLIVKLDYGVAGYFISSLSCALFSFLVFSSIEMRQTGLRFDRRIARVILRYHLPLVPGSLVAFMGQQSERFILRALGSLDRVGILEMGYKFPSLLPMFIHGPLMRAWEPRRIELAESGAPDAPSQIGRMAALSLWFLTTGALAMAVSIEDLLQLLTPPEFWRAVRIAQIDCVTVTLAAFTYHVNFGYFYRNDTSAWSWLKGVLAVAKIGFSALFIWLWDIAGAAYSALVAEVLGVGFSWKGGQRRYRIAHDYRAYASTTLLAVAIFCAAELFKAPLLAASATAASRLAPLWEQFSFVTPHADEVLLRYATHGIAIACKLALCLPMLMLLPSIRRR